MRARFFLLSLSLAGQAAAQHDHPDPGSSRAASPSAAVAGARAEDRIGGSRAWTRAPLLLPARGGERAAVLLRPTGIEAAAVEVFSADGPGDKRRLSVAVGPEGARIAPAAPDTGNYHWLVARQESAGVVRVASTAWYFSNPGKAPTELLRQPKHELEIVPDPLPREHGNYRESEKWRFLVRYKGSPLAGQPLTLETEFGSRLGAVTDPRGVAVVVFPRDFKAAGREAEGGHGPRRARFVLQTRHEADGTRYETAFNYTYAADGDRDRSLSWGVAFGLLGMVAAVPLLRRRETGPGRGERNV